MPTVRLFLRLVFGLAFFLCGAYCIAGSYTGATVSVSTTVSANCTVSTLPVNFGSYDPVGTNKTNALPASGNVTIACVGGSAPTIALGLGANASGTTRRMKNTASADYLSYELYQPPCLPLSVVWGTAGSNLFSPGSPSTSAARSYSICGNVPAGQDPRIGTYNDTITATVNF